MNKLGRVMLLMTLVVANGRDVPSVDFWAEKMISAIMDIQQNASVIGRVVDQLKIQGIIERDFRLMREEIRKYEFALDENLIGLLDSLRTEHDFPMEVNRTLLELRATVDAVERATSNHGHPSKHHGRGFKLLEAVLHETPSGQTILHSIVKLFENIKDERCGRGRSLRQELNSLYSLLVVEEIKGFLATTEQTVWTCSSSRVITCNVEDLSKKGRELDSNLKKWKSSFKAIIQKAPNSIRRCDASKKNHGETYAEIAGLVYAFVVNKTDFRDDHNEIYCSTRCSSITRSSQDCPAGSCPRSYRQVCPGRIFDCSNEGNYEVCESEKKSTRHYEWIKRSHDSNEFGDSRGGCRSATKHYPQRVEKQYDHTCKACMCMCENSDITLENQTIRAISFLQSEATWNESNMVAVGARLVAQDRMIHVQLREGKLLPNGKIAKDSERWIPLPTFEYKNNFPHTLIHPDGARRTLREKIDYGLINLTQNRINLDDLSAPPGHVIAGARFVGGHKLDVSLDISYVKFDPVTGSVTGNSSRFVSELKNISHVERCPLDLDRPDNPLKLARSLPSDSGTQGPQFVTIGVSDKGKDASQSVVPFFDLLEVTTRPSAPLSAIGLFHKGNRERTSGGYVSLRIHPVTID